MAPPLCSSGRRGKGEGGREISFRRRLERKGREDVQRNHTDLPRLQAPVQVMVCVYAFIYLSVILSPRSGSSGESRSSVHPLAAGRTGVLLDVGHGVRVVEGVAKGLLV